MRKSPLAIIDAHAHCGVIDRSFAQSFEDYEQQVAGTGIGGVALFSPVLEIYDRYDFHFTDTPAWRRRRQASNATLLSLKPAGLTVFPYFFIWNDFAVEQLTAAHRGIKWHRHAGEPVYRYDDPRCRAALGEIRRRNLPVVLEEELHNTLHFVRELADGITVIIPHLGLLPSAARLPNWARCAAWDLTPIWKRRCWEAISTACRVCDKGSWYKNLFSRFVSGSTYAAGAIARQNAGKPGHEKCRNLIGDIDIQDVNGKKIYG